MLPSRTIIAAYVVEASQKKQNRRKWVEKRLREDFPDTLESKVRRNGVAVTPLDLILDDLDSYGSTQAAAS